MKRRLQEEEQLAKAKVRLAQETMLTTAEAEKLHAAFRKLDLDGNGFIDRYELEQMYLSSTSEVGFDDANAAVSEILRKQDKNGDGQIEFGEFYEAVTGRPFTDEVKKMLPKEAAKTVAEGDAGSSCCIIF